MPVRATMGENATPKQERNRKVGEFRNLHRAGEILILPCA